MLTPKRRLTAIVLASATLFGAPVAALTNLEQQIEDYLSEQREVVEEVEMIRDLVEMDPPLQASVRPWTGDFTPNEMAVLNFFQDYGITDKAALAVLLGNVKQESKFVTDICEGGRRGPYHSCTRGGFGLIQWTTHGRYDGLGRHASAIGGDPTHIDTQLSYLVTEVEWKKVEHIFKQEGRSIASYMNAAYRWLGWGVHGARTIYSNQYYNQLRST